MEYHKKTSEMEVGPSHKLTALRLLKMLPGLTLLTLLPPLTLLSVLTLVKNCTQQSGIYANIQC